MSRDETWKKTDRKVADNDVHKGLSKYWKNVVILSFILRKKDKSVWQVSLYIVIQKENFCQLG